MIPFAASSTACQAIAHQTIADRVHDAEHRAVVRAVKAERRAARRAESRAAQAAYDERVRRLPAWALRFAHPVH